MPLSKNQKKLITALAIKKYRDQYKLFTAEGAKLVPDLLASGMEAESIYVTPNCTSDYNNSTLVSVSEMKQISNFKTPSDIFAVFHIPSYVFSLQHISSDLVLALDNIQDPGNLGTIVRLADWFGIENIICSINTADLYAPKAVQATMGALARVKLHYIDLASTLEQAEKSGILIYGTFLDGESIYNSNLSKNGIIVIGNEGKGINEEVARSIKKKLLIPSVNKNTSESLNVAMATAIVCSEFRRNTLL